jgi:hypothetical protein
MFDSNVQHLNYPRPSIACNEGTVLVLASSIDPSRASRHVTHLRRPPPLWSRTFAWGGPSPPSTATISPSSSRSPTSEIQDRPQVALVTMAAASFFTLSEMHFIFMTQSIFLIPLLA